jgi:Na+-translocating ferredoxin:NAD+ oxidoreductase RNF subunit RnfB
MEKTSLVGILGLVTIKDMEKNGIIRQAYEALSKLNSGLCGYGNCGQFARTVAEGRVSPFGCQQNPRLGYRINQIIGVKVPAYSYQFQPAFVPKAGVPPWPKALKEELRALSQTADDILVRIEKLAQK